MGLSARARTTLCARKRKASPPARGRNESAGRSRYVWFGTPLPQVVRSTRAHRSRTAFIETAIGLGGDLRNRYAIGCRRHARRGLGCAGRERIEARNRLSGE